VVAALERIAAFPVQVQPGAAGDQDGEMSSRGVIYALDQVFPVPVFMELVKDNEVCPRVKVRVEYLFPVPRGVPEEILGCAEFFSCHAGQGGLADLAGAADEDHLVLEIVDYTVFHGSVAHGIMIPFFLPQVKKNHDKFRLEVKIYVIVYQLNCPAQPAIMEQEEGAPCISGIRSLTRCSSSRRFPP